MDTNSRMYHLLEWPDQPKAKDKETEEVKDKEEEN